MNRRLTLEERVAKLERILKSKNEAETDLAKIIPTVVKNLPLLLELLPPVTEALKNDMLNKNKNKDKIDLLERFTKDGEEVLKMFGELQAQ